MPFTVRTWTLEHGLPASSVQDIAQTPDGYLWVTTTGGIARFDGVRFEVFGLQHGLPSNRLQGLVVTSDGTLYASCEDGSVVRWDGRGFISVPSGSTIPAHTLLPLPDGSVLGSSTADMWIYRNGVGRIVPSPLAWHGVPRVDARGRVWLLLNTRPCRLDGERIVTLGPNGDSRDRWIPDYRDGSVLFHRATGADAELLDDALRPRVRLAGAGRDRAHLVDREGRLWSIRGPDLILRDVRDGHLVARIPLGLAEDAVRLFMDRDGNVWVGTQTQGLMRVAPSALRLLRPPNERLPIQFTTAYERLDGTVIGRDSPLERAWRVEGDVLRALPDEPHSSGWMGTNRTRFRTVDNKLEIRDSTGIGGVIDAGLVWLSQPSQRTPNVLVDPEHPLSVYVHQGITLSHLSFDPAQRARTTIGGSFENIRHMVFGAQGQLWVTTISGLWRIAHGDTQRFTTRDGLPTNHLRQIHLDRDGRLWIGTYGGGLVRFDGKRFATLDVRNGLLEPVVSVVLEDDDGNLWLGGNAGIQRISRAQANECLDGKRARVDAVGYGRESGLLNPEGSGFPGLRSRDGRLWFPTFDGLAVVDPRLARALAGSAPSPAIEAVLAGDQPVERGERGFVLAPDQRRFTIRYTGVDLRAPEQVRFRYRLEGFDRDWIDAGGARTATYTNVPPGRHRFRLVATSGTGLESAAPAEVVFELRPHFWETWPFQAMAVAAFMFAMVMAVRWRSRRLIARAGELQRAVDERTAELVEAKARTETALSTVEAQAHRLESLDRARSRFFASISHEFRTPLTLIQGPLQDVREGLHGEVRPGAREQVGIALDSAVRLQRLVEQLLDAARAEAGELRLERREGDLIAFLDELALGFAPLAERKRITFERRLPGEAAHVSFDPLALEKVFANLLGNAFKFTPAGGHVTLTASRIQGAEPALEIAVADDGPGIAAEDLPRVFERFYRAERSVTRVQPGTGLGLALARDMVEQHGGTIAVESREGHGSTFTVRLPLLAEAPGPSVEAAASGLDPVTLAGLADEIRLTSEPPVADSAAPTGEDVPTVLVVDDHPDVRSYVANRLRSRYRVVEAADGEQALALMRSAAPDLVVSDLAMPVMDGLALCRAIREDPELEFVPVVLLTAAAGTDSKVAGLEGGADDYLTKPFEVKELLARLGQLLHSRRRLRERLARNAAATMVYGTVPPPAAGDPADGEARTPGLADKAGSPFAASLAAARSAVDTAFVRRLGEVVEARMGEEDFDIERLAEAMGMGRTLLYQRTGEVMGKTPMELIFDYRLERAAALLAAGEGGVGEIAYAVGFRSVSHFTNRFRERFGVTPTVWKRGQRPADGTSRAETATT